MSVKKFVKNISYLGGIQMLTLLVPFLYYPFLIRYMGAENYGFVIYVQAIIIMLGIFVDFGFNLYGTKEASQCRDEKVGLSKLYSSIVYIKILIFLFLIPFYILLVEFLPSSGFPNAYYIYIFMYLLLINEVFFSQWFFQGVEEIKYAAIINLSSRMLLLMVIFIGANTNLGVYSFPLGLILSAMLNAILSILTIKYKFGVNFILVEFNDIINHAKASSAFFFSRVANIFILKINSFIIGNTFGMNYVAYYDLAEKLVNLLTIPLNILNQVTYPKVSKDKNYKFVYFIIKLSVSYALATYLFIYLFGQNIIHLFAGGGMEESFKLLCILLVTLPINATSYFVGNCILIVSGHIKSFNMSILHPGLVYLAILGGCWAYGFLSPATLAVMVVMNCFFVCLYRVIVYFRIKKYL